MTTHGSIGSSTMSTFDPENEALASTRQLDQDYMIDNSALRRAFPDFSTGSTRSDISVEVGRGYQYQKVQALVDDSKSRECVGIMMLTATVCVLTGNQRELQREY
jgi:hypothetical protein